MNCEHSKATGRYLETLPVSKIQHGNLTQHINNKTNIYSIPYYLST